MKDSSENKQAAAFDFEGSLRELEKLVTRMEEGKLSLEESVQCYEQGLGLYDSCHKALEQAEHKVQQLTEAHGRQELKAFDAEAEEQD